MNRPEGSGIRVSKSGVKTVWSMDEVRSRCDEVGNCLIWRGGVNSAGYPMASFKGKSKSVGSIVYTDILGKERKLRYRLTTRCHNPRCVSDICLHQSKHGDILSAAHKRRRESDPLSLRRDQRASSRAKLSPEIAEEVRASPKTAIELGAELGVHPESIRSIRRGNAYKAPMSAANSVFDLARLMA